MILIRNYYTNVKQGYGYSRVPSTKLLNTPIQRTAADVLKYALWILSGSCYLYM